MLWDCLGIIAKAQELGYCTAQEVLDAAYEKFILRKPFLLEGRQVTQQEERELWEKLKQEERKFKK